MNDNEVQKRIVWPDGWKPGDWIGKYMKLPYLDSVVLITGYSGDDYFKAIELSGSHHGRPGMIHYNHILEQGEFVECEIKIVDGANE